MIKCLMKKTDKNNHIYGYARVSTQQQDLIRQLDLIKNYNCVEVLTEKMSGTKSDRPELNRLKDKVRSGDTIIIESFSRLGRSTKDLIELVDFFQDKGVKLISVKENFDTNTPQGKLMLTVFQAFSQFERDLIVQRTKEGLSSARARGRKGGRPKVKDKNIEKAINLYNSKEYSINEIITMSGISSATLYRYLQAKNKSKPVNIPDNNSNIEKTVEVLLYLRVERNNKFVRGIKKTKEEIEWYLTTEYSMRRDEGNDYILKISYLTLEALENEVYDILAELESIAEMNNCFTESDVTCDELGLSW